MTPVPLDTQQARANYKWVSTSALHPARLSNGMGKAEEDLNGNAYTQEKSHHFYKESEEKGEDKKYEQREGCKAEGRNGIFSTILYQ